MAKLFKLIYYIFHRNLPFVHIICTRNHTKYWAFKADSTRLHYVTPRHIGFLNAKKRGSVAAQAAAIAMGQKLRLLNVRTVRVRLDGFNVGRIAALKGLASTGLTIVSISDVTPVNWDWPQRAKKPKRQR